MPISGRVAPIADRPGLDRLAVIEIRGRNKGAEVTEDLTDDRYGRSQTVGYWPDQQGGGDCDQSCVHTVAAQAIWRS